MAAAYQPRYRPPTVYFEPSSVPPSPPPGALLVQVQPVAVPSSAVPPPAPYVYDEFNEFRSAVPGTAFDFSFAFALSLTLGPVAYAVFACCLPNSMYKFGAHMAFWPSLVCSGIALVVMGALAALGSTPFLNASFPWLQSLVGAVRSVPFFVIGIPLVVAGAIGLGIWSAKLDKFRRFYATIPEDQLEVRPPSFGPSTITATTTTATTTTIQLQPLPVTYVYAQPPPPLPAPQPRFQQPRYAPPHVISNDETSSNGQVSPFAGYSAPPM